MAIPILLVAGFLGAGKTTLINQLLRNPGGKRIAAIVNDFGAIDIDAALLESSTEGLVSLKNGCICCSLQGDLLRSLASVTRRHPVPDAVVIETSGISDPAEIIRNLLDPVIFKAAALETVATLVDAHLLTNEPQLWDDPLWLSQARSADVLLVTKAELIGQDAAAHLIAKLQQRFLPKPVFRLLADLPLEILFGYGPGEQRAPGPARPTSLPFFATTSWTATKPLSLAKFQHALNVMSQTLLRAKGIVTFAGEDPRPLLFQLVGSRATLTPSPLAPGDGLEAAIVLIAREELADLTMITSLLDEAVCL
ncbi:GTP-binding protein [Bosea sp. 124]|uniref:CobW family GTP-binding protein n=1 Tax=Bosea sp. 124 TaxID=2135642 RepID=UPI000D3AA7B6|nr:GTP-binding protein [Bosea sp. 124]PTM39286.1 cobalamin biosynthesis protein CobW [Bosea sp. 124]